MDLTKHAPGQFPKTERLTTRHLLVITDFASLFVSFYSSYLLLPYWRPYLDSGPYQLDPFTWHLWILLLISPAWYFLLLMSGLYSSYKMAWWIVLARVAGVLIRGVAALSVLIFAFKLAVVSRLLVFGFCALYVPVFLPFRWIILSFLESHRSHIYRIPRILVIGSLERAREFIRRARSDEESIYELVGCLDPDPRYTHGTVEGVPILGTTDLFRRIIFDQSLDVVAFAMPPEQIPDTKEMIQEAVELGLRVVVVPDFYIHRLGGSFESPFVSIESFIGIPSVVFSTLPRRTAYLFAKRAVDVAVSAILLVLLSPFFVLISLLIKLTSNGSVFYPWNVLGINKRPFVAYKFRTMVRDADRKKSALMEFNEMQGPVFKMKRDPRITPVGRILRKYSLDELPQLYSVLKGDMSLVGPRPPFKEEADRFEFWQRRKLSVKPGITCLWQVNGRNDINSFEEWARLDLEYVQKASFWLDCKILLQTIPVVLKGRGAY